MKALLCKTSSTMFTLPIQNGDVLSRALIAQLSLIPLRAQTISVCQPCPWENAFLVAKVVHTKQRLNGTIMDYALRCTGQPSITGLKTLLAKFRQSLPRRSTRMDPVLNVPSLPMRNTVSVLQDD
mmetsp:Transcript_6777/g.13940  ORF Transcript_6777/g.13940 Transcript_6777/m.13940 type:complete len:125 (-) Transcript_6777:117-491(-)